MHAICVTSGPEFSGPSRAALLLEIFRGAPHCERFHLVKPNTNVISAICNL